jgi:hypothetical protein
MWTGHFVVFLLVNCILKMSIMPPVSDKLLPLVSGMCKTFVISKSAWWHIVSSVPGTLAARLPTCPGDKRYDAICVIWTGYGFQQLYLHKTNRGHTEPRLMTSYALLLANTVNHVCGGTGLGWNQRISPLRRMYRERQRKITRKITRDCLTLKQKLKIRI